jgi:hypothetical protein
MQITKINVFQLLNVLCKCGYKVEVAIIPSLNYTSEAHKKKFNVLYKQYHLGKMANGISRSDRKECKYYEAFDQWWH